MADLNKVAIIGRLTRDAELKYTAGGLAIMNFSIAVNRKKKQGDQWVDEVSFFDCQYFGHAAETIKQYMLKGKQVAIDGYLKQDRWEADGMARSRIYINCDVLQLLGGNAGSNNNAEYNIPQPGGINTAAGAPYDAGSFPDDVPF